MICRAEVEDCQVQPDQGVRLHALLAAGRRRSWVSSPGCVGKSAQFPLHVWLPDAMEGPTPVSALIHAATMVAAGVYLVGRCYPLFTPEARLVIAYTGGITLFVAATVAIVMTDIKKVLAYSTVSQLGYMMLALGVGGWVAGLFHLLTHAFFKALLFLGSGSGHLRLPSRAGNDQDGRPRQEDADHGRHHAHRRPGHRGHAALRRLVQQGRDHRPGVRLRLHPPRASLLLLLPLITAGITTFYMFRMWFMTFTGEPRDHHVYEHAHESPWLMTVPLVLLAVCSIGVAWGWPVYDAEASRHGKAYSSCGTPGLPRPISVDESAAGQEHQPERSGTGRTRSFTVWRARCALLAAGLGFVFALVIYRLSPRPGRCRRRLPGPFRFLWHKWYFDEAYSVLWFALRWLSLTGAGRSTPT